MRSKLWGLASALAVALTLPMVARADLDAGIAAFEVKDYAEALRQFSAPDMARDHEALRYLARMAYQALGQPKDLTAAYAYASLSVMNDPSGPNAKAVGNRRMVARSMTPEQIREGEQLVIRHLQEDMGNEGLVQALDEAITALQDCSKDGCVAAARQIVTFGPSAVLATPRLEQLMTADPMWIPRQTYAFALYAIGTQAVPALCRIAEDKDERQREGTWNIMQVAVILGLLGPVAPEGRECLLRVMRDLDTNQPAEQEQLGLDIAGEENAMLYETEINIAIALAAIGDPDRVSEAAAHEIYRAEPEGDKGRLMAYAIGLVYGDLGPMLDQAPAGLAHDRLKIRADTMLMLLHLSETADFARRVQPLVPALKGLAEGPDPDLADLAKQLLDLVGP